MLQSVSRPSIESPRIAAPAYSMTCPVAPAVPMVAMMCRMTSLAVDAGAERALHGDAHGLRPPLPQALRRQHMRDLRHADAEGERTERAMGGGVAVAADDDHAGLADAGLRPDHMHDALAWIVQPEQREAVRRRVALQRLDHLAQRRVRDLARPRACRSACSGPAWRRRAPARAARRRGPSASRRPGRCRHAAGAGRHRAGSGRPRRSSTRWRSQILSNIVRGARGSDIVRGGLGSVMAVFQ